MTARSSRVDPPTQRPFPGWIITAGALVVLTLVVFVLAVIGFVLWPRYREQGAHGPVQLDMIRTGVTLLALIGGAVALWLTARRQLYTELSLVHTTRDATERRTTELYSKAADQLGSDKAPVRLAGLYALERLAQNTPEQRQTIVDVICSYLRMPYTPPDEQSPAEDAPAKAHARYENRRQEQQVRLTAQNILSRNLRVVGRGRRRWWHRTPANVLAWPGIGLDLAGALLLEFSLTNCQLDYANFTHTQFIGEANFEMGFTGRADFRNARFTGEASFVGAEFTNLAFFEGTQFTDMVHFRDAQFAYGASFGKTQFSGPAFFRDTQFTGEASFEGAKFTAEAIFMGAKFTDLADFVSSRFTGEASFRDAQFTFRNAYFTDQPDFERARVASTAGPVSVWPLGWTTRPAKPGNGEDPTFLYLTRVKEAKPPGT